MPLLIYGQFSVSKFSFTTATNSSSLLNLVVDRLTSLLLTMMKPLRSTTDSENTPSYGVVIVPLTLNPVISPVELIITLITAPDPVAPLFGTSRTVAAVLYPKPPSEIAASSRAFRPAVVSTLDAVMLFAVNPDPLPPPDCSEYGPNVANLDRIPALIPELSIYGLMLDAGFVGSDRDAI